MLGYPGSCYRTVGYCVGCMYGSRRRVTPGRTPSCTPRWPTRRATSCRCRREARCSRWATESCRRPRPQHPDGPPAAAVAVATAVAVVPAAAATAVTVAAAATTAATANHLAGQTVVPASRPGGVLAAELAADLGGDPGALGPPGDARREHLHDLAQGTRAAAPVSSMAAVTSAPSSSSLSWAGRYPSRTSPSARSAAACSSRPGRGERLGGLPAPFRLPGEHPDDLVVGQLPG